MIQTTYLHSLLIRDSRNDPALRHLLLWITRGTPPSSQILQGRAQTTWKLALEFRSLKVVNDILFREFIHKGGSSHHQQLLPASLVPQILKSIHSSPTGGHLGIFKTVEKVRERLYWPGFQEDNKLFINCCEQCQKRANPPKTHQHSLVEWTPSYPFHHIGINFMAPSPLSNGNQHILSTSDHFSKWYEAIPLPDQTALQQLRPFSKIDFVFLDVPIAYTVIKVVTLNQSF